MRWRPGCSARARTSDDRRPGGYRCGPPARARVRGTCSRGRGSCRHLRHRERQLAKHRPQPHDIAHVIFDHLVDAAVAHGVPHQAAGGRILSIHSRRAASEVLDRLAAVPDAGTPILHWFSGTQRQLDRAIDLGCWFSVGRPCWPARRGGHLLPKCRGIVSSPKQTGRLHNWMVGPRCHGTRSERCLFWAICGVKRPTT